MLIADPLQEQREGVGADRADGVFRLVGRRVSQGEKKPVTKGTASVNRFVVAGGDGDDSDQCHQASNGDQKFSVLSHERIVANAGEDEKRDGGIGDFRFEISKWG
jgi:hypothetical protein